MIHGCASMSSAGMWRLRSICRGAGVPMSARRSQTAGSRLRGNDVVVCGNDVMGCGNDVVVCGSDGLACGNDVVVRWVYEELTLFS